MLHSEPPLLPLHRGAPAQGRHGAPGAGSAEGYKHGEGTRASLLGEKAEGAGPVQPQEKTERGPH